MFHVGQKVVCIDATSYGPWPHLKQGAVYTVLLTTAFDGNRAYLTVDCQEGGGQYMRHRFRPIVEKKTDISIFTKMLTGTKEPAHS